MIEITWRKSFTLNHYNNRQNIGSKSSENYGVWLQGMDLWRVIHITRLMHRLPVQSAETLRKIGQSFHSSQVKCTTRCPLGAIIPTQGKWTNTCDLKLSHIQLLFYNIIQNLIHCFCLFMKPAGLSPLDSTEAICQKISFYHLDASMQIFSLMISEDDSCRLEVTS